MANRRIRGVNFLSLPLQRRMMSQSNFLMLSAEDTRIIRECIRSLSERQRDMLDSVLYTNDGEAVSRAQIAGEWSRERLLDYHIRLLNHLVDRGLVIEQRAGREYFYRLLPGVRAVLEDQIKRENEAAKQKRQTVLTKMPPPGDNKLYEINGKVYRNTSTGMVEHR